MSRRYFLSYRGGSSIDVNLSLTRYAIKEDFKNLSVDTSSFPLKTNLTGLKTKVDDLKANADTFSLTATKLFGATFFNNIRLCIAALRAIKNTELNEYIKNTFLKSLADIVDGIIKDPAKNDVENKIKTLVNEPHAKITDIVIKKKVN